MPPALRADLGGLRPPRKAVPVVSPRERGDSSRENELRVNGTRRESPRSGLLVIRTRGSGSLPHKTGTGLIHRTAPFTPSTHPAGKKLGSQFHQEPSRGDHGPAKHCWHPASRVHSRPHPPQPGPPPIGIERAVQGAHLPERVRNPVDRPAYATPLGEVLGVQDYVLFEVVF